MRTRYQTKNTAKVEEGGIRRFRTRPFLFLSPFYFRRLLPFCSFSFSFSFSFLSNKSSPQIFSFEHPCLSISMLVLKLLIQSFHTLTRPDWPLASMILKTKSMLCSLCRQQLWVFGEGPKHAKTLNFIGFTPCWLKYQTLGSLGPIVNINIRFVPLEVSQSKLRDGRNLFSSCITHLAEFESGYRPTQTRHQR